MHTKIILYIHLQRMQYKSRLIGHNGLFRAEREVRPLLEERAVSDKKMNRYNELKLQVLALFASTQGEWLGPNEAAEKLDFFPARSAWTYFKRLWKFGLLERRSRGRGTLEYKISDLGRTRLRWLLSQRG